MLRRKFQAYERGKRRLTAVYGPGLPPISPGISKQSRPGLGLTAWGRNSKKPRLPAPSGLREARIGQEFGFLPGVPCGDPLVRDNGSGEDRAAGWARIAIVLGTGQDHSKAGLHGDVGRVFIRRLLRSQADGA